jgi:hypothetical protein
MLHESRARGSFSCRQRQPVRDDANPRVGSRGDGKGAVNALTRWEKRTFAVTSTSVSQAGRKADTPEDKARKRILPKAGKIILGRAGIALLKHTPESLLPYSGVDHVLRVAPAAHRIYMTALFWLGVMTFSQRRPDALAEQIRHDALPSRAVPSALVYIA